MKQYSLISSIGLCLIIIISSCRKDAVIDTSDERDDYVGTYSGIEIYEDFQLGTKDTTEVEIFLKKFNYDTLTAIQLVLPSTEEYLYKIEDDSLVSLEGFYHPPKLTFKGDSLYCLWIPSLAPRSYRYETVKVP